MMSPEGAREKLLRELRRLQKQQGITFRLTQPLNTTWRSKNGALEVVGWGKLLVRHITQKRAFQRLVDRKKNQILAFPNSDAASRDDLQYPIRIDLERADSVTLTA